MHDSLNWLINHACYSLGGFGASLGGGSGLARSQSHCPRRQTFPVAAFSTDISHGQLKDNAREITNNSMGSRSATLSANVCLPGDSCY